MRTFYYGVDDQIWSIEAEDEDSADIIVVNKLMEQNPRIVSDIWDYLQNHFSLNAYSDIVNV